MFFLYFIQKPPVFFPHFYIFVNLLFPLRGRKNSGLPGRGKPAVYPIYRSGSRPVSRSSIGVIIGFWNRFINLVHLTRKA